MADRAEIAERHGLPPEHASKLVGNTAEELEADAAARAALARMFGPTDAQPARVEQELGGSPEVPPTEGSSSPPEPQPESEPSADEVFLQRLFAPKPGHAEAVLRLHPEGEG